MALRDLDFDDDLDLFHSKTGISEVWLGDGNGGVFDTGKRLGAAASSLSLALGDFDNDLDIDAFVNPVVYLQVTTQRIVRGQNFNVTENRLPDYELDTVQAVIFHLPAGTNQNSRIKNQKLRAKPASPRSRRITCAALWPGAPLTSPCGCMPAPHKYRFGSGAL